MTYDQNRNQHRRSGMAILLVLIFLMVITTIVGAMLRYLVLSNRQTKQRMHAAQAFWLADAGVERAVFSLRQNPAYRNENWNATAAAFEGRAGQVEIQVEPLLNDVTQVTVSVLATFPTGSRFSVKARRKVIVRVPVEQQSVAQSTDEVDQGAQNERE